MQSHVGGCCVDKDDSECAGKPGGEGLPPVAAGVWVCGCVVVGV